MVPNLDRFSSNMMKDAQDALTYDYCSYCKNDVFMGDSYLASTEDDTIHDDLECVVGYFQLQRKWAGDEII